MATLTVVTKIKEASPTTTRTNVEDKVEVSVLQVVPLAVTSKAAIRTAIKDPQQGRGGGKGNVYQGGSNQHHFNARLDVGPNLVMMGHKECHCKDICLREDRIHAQLSCITNRKLLRRTATVFPATNQNW